MWVTAHQFLALEILPRVMLPVFRFQVLKMKLLISATPNTTQNGLLSQLLNPIWHVLLSVHDKHVPDFFHDYVKFDPYVTISTTFITYNSEFDIVKMLQPWVMNVTQILESLIGVRQRKLRARLTHSFRHPSQHPGWFLAPSDNVTVEHYGTGSRKKQISEKRKRKILFWYSNHNDP